MLSAKGHYERKSPFLLGGQGKFMDQIGFEIGP